MVLAVFIPASLLCGRALPRAAQLSMQKVGGARIFILIDAHFRFIACLRPSSHHYGRGVRGCNIKAGMFLVISHKDSVVTDPGLGTDFI